MHPTPDDQFAPRFPDVSRRAFLRRSAVASLAVAALPALAACGTSTSNSTSPGTTAPGSAPAAAQPASSAAPSTGATTDPTPASAQAVPAGQQVQIDFTYQASGGGRVHSPYIAVWIEDAAGELVQTVSLWYKQDESKYLKDLKRWNSKNNASALITGATRIPGSFSVTWDGSDLRRAPAASGDYHVCIEAAREDGPYQIIRELVALSGELAPTTLTPSGELTAASVGITS